METSQHDADVPNNPGLTCDQLREDIEYSLRIVLVGKTGAGMSATGNTLLGKNVFDSKLQAQSVTNESLCKEARHNGFNIAVIDTPGFFNTQLGPSEIDAQILRCVSMSYPGPHAFLHVLQIGRFTAEDISALNRTLDIFGNGIGICSILLFTGLDRLQIEGRTINEYISKSDDQLKKYISNCGGRYFAINNVDTAKGKEKTAKTLLSFISDMVKDNGGKHFSNNLFKNIENKTKTIQEKNEKYLHEVKYELGGKNREIRDEKKSIACEAVPVEKQRNEVRQLVLLDPIKNEDTTILEKDTSLANDMILGTRNLEGGDIFQFDEIQAKRELNIQQLHAQVNQDKRKKTTMCSVM